MKNILLLMLLLLIAPAITTAQMVNMGDMYVAQGAVVNILEEFDNKDTGKLINNGNLYFYSHWNNDGVIDFTKSSGYTRFVGKTSQTISGKTTGNLYNVLFKNGASQPAFKLSGKLSVKNTSTFDTGIVDTDNYGGTFTFEKDSNHSSTSDTSFVDGKVVKKGDNPFNYPIGDNGFYRYAKISAPNLPSDNFTGKYFYEDTNTNYPVDKTDSNIELVDSAEHWVIDRIAGTATPTITLSWNTKTTPSAVIASPIDNITIARWNPSLNIWVNEGGIVDTTNKTVTATVSDYGVFTFARSIACVSPTLNVGKALCNSSKDTYTVEFNSNNSVQVTGINVISVTGDKKGTATAKLGTNMVFTASSGKGCETVITVTEPDTCPSECELPNLVATHGVCNGADSYTVVYTETTGAIIELENGINNNDGTITAISGDKDVVIKATNNATGTNPCIVRLIVQAPKNCGDSCSGPSIAVGAAVCKVGTATYSVNYFKIPGATVTANVGDVQVGKIINIPSGVDVIVTSKVDGCSATVITVPSGTCTACVSPTLNVGKAQCNSSLDTYTVEFNSNNSVVVTGALSVTGDKSGTATAELGINMVFTANSGKGCETVITVTEPDTCPTECELPNLVATHGVCNGADSYTVVYTETTGATIELENGINNNDGTITAISGDKDVVIKATNNATGTNPCIVRLVVQAPTNCGDSCSGPSIAVGAAVCEVGAATYSVNYFAIPGATVTANEGDVLTGKIINIPSGVDVIVTSKVDGCSTTVITVPSGTCTDCTVTVNAGNDQTIDKGDQVTLTATATVDCPDCNSFNVENTDYCPEYKDKKFVVWILDSKNQKRWFSNKNLVWTVNSDGTASLRGDIVEENGDLFKVHAIYSGREIKPPYNSPKDHSCHKEDSSNWVYYKTLEGSITKQGGSEVFNLKRRGPAFQVGIGANNYEKEVGKNGGASWFYTLSYSGVSGKGDFNFNIGDCISSSTFEYKWSNGATTPSINVSPDQTTTYTVSVTNNGATASDKVTVTVKEECDPCLSNQYSVDKPYPVPVDATGVLYVKIAVDADQYIEYEIHDKMSGKLIGSVAKRQVKKGCSTIAIDLNSHCNFQPNTHYILIVKGNSWKAKPSYFNTK